MKTTEIITRRNHHARQSKNNAGRILSESGVRYDKVFPIRRSGDTFVIPYLGKGAKNPSTVLYTMDGSHALGASNSKIIKKLAEEARKEEKGL